MTRILYDKRFLRSFRRLPKGIQRKLIALEKIFVENCFHRSLHTKKLQGKLKHLYSFRITREYRVIFMLSSASEVIFLDVRHRKDIYHSPS